MGQGGSVLLVNGTQYDWVRSSLQSQSMNSWWFPPVLPRNGSAVLYTEFQYGGDQTGTAEYVLNCAGSPSFTLQATNTPTQDISVVLTNLATPGQPVGSTVDLGWNHNGIVYFFLYGEQGNFGISVSPATWMHDTLPVFGSRTLRQLCMPGSHDAGMSVITDGTAFGNACNAQTQTAGIFGQLNAGARFFDIRPALSGTTYSTGHYTDTGSPLGYQGCSGETIASIIGDINTFTATNHELIILYLSHDMVTSAGYGPFTQGQYETLMQQLLGINSLFVSTDPNADLTVATLSSFIGNGEAAVIVVIDAPNIDLGDYATKGFYLASSFPTDVNDYTNTPDLATMEAGQYQNLQSSRTTPDDQFFVLSWTLTQTSGMATGCVVSPIGATSVLDLAAEANAVLAPTLMAHCTPQSFPNVLYTDDAANAWATGSALAVSSLTIPPLEVRTSPPFGLAATSAGLSVLYRGSDSRLRMATAPDGTTWGNRVELPGTINTAVAPAAAVGNDTIRILYRGVAGDLTLWSASAPNDWADLVQLPTIITTPASPALAMLNGTCWGIYESSAGDGTLWVASSPDGQQWQLTAQMPTAITTPLPPSMAVLNGALCVLFRSGGDLTMYMTSSTDGVNWNLQQVGSGQTTLWSPAATVFNDDLYVVYRASSDLTMWITRWNGGAWPVVAQLPGGATTPYAPAAAVLGDTLYVLYASSSDYTIWQTSSTDGVHWSAPQQLPESVVLGP